MRICPHQCALFHAAQWRQPSPHVRIWLGRRELNPFVLLFRFGPPLIPPGGGPAEQPEACRYICADAVLLAHLVRKIAKKCETDTRFRRLSARRYEEVEWNAGAERGDVAENALFDQQRCRSSRRLQAPIWSRNTSLVVQTPI